VTKEQIAFRRGRATAFREAATAADAMAKSNERTANSLPSADAHRWRTANAVALDLRDHYRRRAAQVDVPPPKPTRRRSKP
jgi:hypothetical protein